MWSGDQTKLPSNYLEINHRLSVNVLSFFCSHEHLRSKRNGFSCAQKFSYSCILDESKRASARLVKGGGGGGVGADSAPHMAASSPIVASAEFRRIAGCGRGRWRSQGGIQHAGCRAGSLLIVAWMWRGLGFSLACWYCWWSLPASDPPTMAEEDQSPRTAATLKMRLVGKSLLCLSPRESRPSSVSAPAGRPVSEWAAPPHAPLHPPNPPPPPVAAYLREGGGSGAAAVGRKGPNMPWHQYWQL